MEKENETDNTLNGSNYFNERLPNKKFRNQEIKNLLFTYRDALNASDVSKVLSLYTEDGIFIHQKRQLQ